MGLAAIPGRSAEARRDIELALEYACQLGCPQVHIMAGVVPPGADRAACEAVLIDNLRYAAECFARHDKRILIEALNPQTKPGYLYHSQYQTLAMVKRVDRPNLAVQLDLFHAQKVDGNLSHLITEYAGQYRHIQIASLPDRHEPDEGERHCCKVSDEAAFVLFKGLTFQKLCLPGAFRPGDHHNKMLRPGLCVVHASPQYL